MKKIMLKLALILLTVLCLCACAQKLGKIEGNESAIMLKKDGKWQSLMVKELSNEAASIDTEELKSFINKETEDFNAGGSDVSLAEIKYESPYIKILFEYSSFAKLSEYVKYSNDGTVRFSSAELFTVDEFENSEYAGKVDLSSVKKSAKKVLILSGTGVFFSETPILSAAYIGEADTAVEEHKLTVVAHEGQNGDDVKTIIVLK